MSGGIRKKGNYGAREEEAYNKMKIFWGREE
jgi:hypothetical protein